MSRKRLVCERQSKSSRPAQTRARRAETCALNATSLTGQRRSAGTRQSRAAAGGGWRSHGHAHAGRFERTGAFTLDWANSAVKVARLTYPQRCIMDRRLLAICVTLALIVTASTPADDISIGAEVDGIQIETPPSQSQRPASSSSNASCTAQCNSAQSRCHSEVRRARQSCSRTAATGGRDAFDDMARHDASSFCTYFRRPRNCGPGCELRFARHFDMCIDAMNDTVSMRHDCFIQERRAQNFCRQELHDCESACK